MFKRIYFLLALILIIRATSLAQTNFVATNPASITPGADNVIIGVGAGNINMSGSSNLFIGRGSGVQNMAGTKNAFVGAYAGNNNSSGQSNLFVGYSAGLNNNAGNNNTFLGSETGYTNSSGYNNVFSGAKAGYFNTQGNNNAFFGTGAGYSNTQGSDNTFLGSDAGSGNSSGAGNTFVGSLSGSSNGAATQNTFIGNSSGLKNQGNANTFLGYQTGYNNLSGGSNLFAGYQAGYQNTTASYNLFMGNSAGAANTTGSYNVFMGSQAGYTNISGGANIFLGQQSGYLNSSGSFNMFIGNSSGSNNTTGSGNAAIGDGALLRNVSGNNSTAIGQYAGVDNRGSENVFIGYQADVSTGATALTNVVAIGAHTLVGKSNSVILGNNANVGIGTSVPNNKLEITQGTTGSSGLRLTNLTSNFTPSVSTNQFLTVNNVGDVILATAGPTKGGFRQGVAEVTTIWEQRENGHIQNANAGGVVIGHGINLTPDGYKLYVEEGILTEKLKVAVKSTDQWSDHVFQKTYKLRTLTNVEQYIRDNKHLPGIPSAEEVVKEGADVGKMQAKLLEKIEELTLYVIDLKKQNDLIKLKSSSLERRLRKLQEKEKASK